MAKIGGSKLTVAVGDRDHILGNEQARVTLVEYADLECPHCRDVSPVIRELRARLGDRLRYVFRHFPLKSTHTHAQMAAEAVECAGTQGKFWEMLDFVFTHQGALEERHLIEYASRLGLDVDLFTQELKENVYAQRVEEDVQSGIQSGVNSTPTFFINGVRYDGPWDLESLIEAIEKPLGVQVRMLAQEFARIEASGGIILLICAILALIWANSTWSDTYFHLWKMDLGIRLGDSEFAKYLLKWINDGLMVLFFFVVGLEIKREVTTGELSNPRKALLPIFAAIGGMVFPALFYVILNIGEAGLPGWGIPMATDIAFTLGILALLGSRVPLSLKVFFTALAIADDLGAVLVIGLFYTANISWISLLIAALILAALFGLNRARVYSPLPYALLGIGLWLAFLQSGVHPTIAGVLLAMSIPTRSTPDTKALLAQCVSTLEEFKRPWVRPDRYDNHHEIAAQTLETVSERMQSPAQRLEHALHPWTTYLILPIFALANAGVTLSFGSGSAFGPVSLGIILGLVLGKPIGITLLSYLAVRLGIAELPLNVDMRQIFAASWLAGIGFTMSLFIAGAAFTDAGLLDQAKIGILIASLIAGLLGAVLMWFNSPTHAETSTTDTMLQ